MSADCHPLLLAGQWVNRPRKLTVHDKFRGSAWAACALGDREDIEAAIGAAADELPRTARLPAFQREGILRQVARMLENRRTEFVDALISEVGKPRKYADAEVDRTIGTFEEAARRAADLTGEWHALDQSARGQAYRAIWRRFPLGPVACITPFNFPLNLVAHKIAPAIAVGCPFVLKPASATPMSALMLGELLMDTEWPKPAASIVPCHAADAAPLAEDQRVAVLSFTGSADVGWGLKARAGRKRVVLELGGNAAAIVHGDADLTDAARRCAAGGFAQAGQSCISVQRILVEERVYEAFRDLLLEVTKSLEVGDPSVSTTDVGPLISETEAERVERWVGEAVAAGGCVLCGGRRRGAVLEPVVIENAPADAKVNRCEVFGPVVTLAPYARFDDALARANDSDFGLQAGVFTRDIGRMIQAWESLEVGGVIINDAPTFRADTMPYGGMKASGCGREGVRFAMDDYTEFRTLVIRDAPSADR